MCIFSKLTKTNYNSGFLVYVLVFLGGTWKDEKRWTWGGDWRGWPGVLAEKGTGTGRYEVLNPTRYIVAGLF